MIFRAFEVCAASQVRELDKSNMSVLRLPDIIIDHDDLQGCMNNISFGNDSVGYYETVAGGAGAGPAWNGRSGVHSHMTNTRITDPEILEKRSDIKILKS